MSEHPIPDVQPDPTPGEGKLSEEFGALGRNLIEILRVAWERPERQKLQEEIEGGLAELGNTLRKEAKAVSENSVTQRVKSEVEDLGARVRNGQVDVKVREELIGALHLVNAELIKVADHLAGSGKDRGHTPAETGQEGETAQEGAAVVEAEAVGEAPDQPGVEAVDELKAGDAEAADQPGGEEA
jgi:hypothetical protein